MCSLQKRSVSRTCSTNIQYTLLILTDFFLFLSVNPRHCTYPKLSDKNVSDAAQDCHTVKNIPGIFEIVLKLERHGSSMGERRKETKKVEVGVSQSRCWSIHLFVKNECLGNDH